MQPNKSLAGRTSVEKEYIYIAGDLQGRRKNSRINVRRRRREIKKWEVASRI